MELSKCCFLILSICMVSLSQVQCNDDNVDEDVEPMQTITLGGDGDQQLNFGDSDDASDDDDDDEEDSVNMVEMDEGVMVLTDANFDETIENNAIVLVEFYAPWCGHCQKLAPEYAKAASVLSSNVPSVALAKVDATKETELGKRFDVSGYPTLKYFISGKPQDYDGPRDADGIVEYMRMRADPNYKPPPEAVLTLTTENFDEIVDSSELILVEFYAPWCGHCKKLAPELERAAKQLKDDNILIAKVDATVEKDLGTKHGVSGFPTLKVFRKGQASEYKGPRDMQGIVSYMRKQSGEASKLAPGLKTMKSAISKTDASIVAFFASSESAEYKLYQQAANDLRDDYETLMHSFDPDIAAHFQVAQGALSVLLPERFQSKHEPKKHDMDLTSSPDVAAITAHIRDRTLPLVGEMDSLNDKRYAGKRPIVIFIYDVNWSFDYRQGTQYWRTKILSIAKDYKKQLTFAIIDEEKLGDELAAFGFDDSGSDMNVAILGEKDVRFPMPPMDDYESDDVREFIDEFLKGKLKPRIKSQPVPRQQKPDAVQVVVGNSFESVVLDAKKDVLIEMYAPWCGHCKKLEPVYKKLAKKFADVPDVVIAKMDATANDPPAEFSVEGFPTLYFVAAGSDKPEKYEGGNSLDELEKYVRKMATVSLEPSKGKDEL